MKQAIFLDRDGTLIKDSGFLGNPSKVSIYPFAMEALKILQESFDLFIVSNQCGIAGGAISIEDVDRVNKYIIDIFAADGIDIKYCYICPHAIGARCKCRKPQPFFAQLAASTYGLDLSRSYVIGDHPSDMDFAKAFGGHGVYVLTGHGRHHYHSLSGDITVSRNILFAARKIMAPGNTKIKE